AEAARALIEGLPDARAGIADGIFTAEHAARTTRQDDPIRIVAPGASAAFLAPLPVKTLDRPQLTELLTRLGVHTLGAFAALSPSQIDDRFGADGVRLHALAAGADSRPVTPQAPTTEFARGIDLEPPLELAEQVAFAARQCADAVFDTLSEALLVCTGVRIVLTDERGGVSEQVWLHPTFFDAAAIIDRIRWQLQEGAAPDAAIARVRIAPVTVDSVSHHHPSLIDQGPNERLHHAVSRVQSMLGHRGVVTAAVGGGRWLAEREVRVPWGDGTKPPRSRDAPWPGSLPQPLPSEVFRAPRRARVTGADGAPVRIDERGALSSPPAALDGRALTTWAGPWPLIERGWDAGRSRRAHRFQLVDDTQQAWLAVCETDGWWLEGRYG
ncbi:MAG: DNA polymerase Y family protein, partial [Microbacterium sp.]